MQSIIGITGTLGAGKGTVAEYLKKKGFVHYSVREYLIEEIKKRGMPVNRDNMVEVANELRAGNSPSYIIEELYKRAEEDGRPSIIESIRTPGEVEALRKYRGFILIAVDADQWIRYNRNVQRNSETDNQTFERFVEDEKREMSSGDPNKQNIGKCMKMADIHIENNSSIEALHSTVDKALAEIAESS
jgi:dephospho-CoA kinase